MSKWTFVTCLSNHDHYCSNCFGPCVGNPLYLNLLFAGYRFPAYTGARFLHNRFRHHERKQPDFPLLGSFFCFLSPCSRAKQFLRLFRANDCAQKDATCVFIRMWWNSKIIYVQHVYFSVKEKVNAWKRRGYFFHTDLSFERAFYPSYQSEILKTRPL